MRSNRASSSLPLAVLLSALLLIEGCYSWKVQPPSPEALAARKPGAVRVFRRDGSTETLLAPHFTADSVVGRGVPGRPVRVAVAFEDVQRVEAKQSNAVKTLGAVFGVTFAVLGVATIIAVASWNGPFGN